MTLFLRHYFHCIKSVVLLLVTVLSCNSALAMDKKKGILDEEIGNDTMQYIHQATNYNPLADASAPPFIPETTQKKKTCCDYLSWTRKSAELLDPLYATELSSGQSAQGIPMTVVGVNDITILDQEPTEMQKEWRNLCESLSHCGAKVLGCFTGTINCIEGAIDGCGKLKNCCKHPDTNHYNSYGNSPTSCCDRLVSYSQWSRHQCAVFMTAVISYAIPIALIVGGSVMVNEGQNHGARTVTYTARCHDEDHHAYSCTKTACEGASPHYCNIYQWGESLTTLGCFGFVFVTCVFLKVAAGR